MRAQCIATALEYLEIKGLLTSHVLVHDVSQPLISAALLDRVIAGVKGGDAVVMPALPVTDSVKAVNGRGAVTGTLDRSVLRSVQYPRGFAVGQLSQLLARCTHGDFDELEEAIGARVPIAVVDGDDDGFRVVLPADTQFVEAVMARRPDLLGR
jgi:2-C-methyl-D-erythritol 4-phosphate cytidylyltransferase